MKRYEFFLGHGEIVTGEAIGGEWVRYSDHVEAMKRIAGDSAQQAIPVAEVTAGNLGSRLMWHTEDAQSLTPVGTLLYAAPAPSASPAALTDEVRRVLGLCVGPLNIAMAMAGIHSNAASADETAKQCQDALDGIRALLAASPADQVGWQLIEEAPKDREVWAFNGEQGRMQWSEGSADNGEGWALWVWCDPLLSDADPEPEQPTHFMPLPADPVAAISASKEGA